MSRPDELEPLPPAVERALDFERARPAASAERRARLLARIATSVPPVPGAHAPSYPGTAGSAGVAGLKASASLLPLWTFLAGALVGGGTVAALTVRRPEAPLAQAIVHEPVAPPAPAPVAEPRPAPEASPAVAAKPKRAPVPKAPSTQERPAGNDLLLERERVLVERARSALARGAAADALSAVKAHDAEFPNGRLAEERELLWIHALVATGDSAAAKSRAETFKRRFPDSLLTPSVEASVPAPP